MMAMLDKCLDEDFLVARLDFQSLGNASFQDENTFSLAFLELFLWEKRRHHAQVMPGMDSLMEKMETIVEDGEQVSFAWGTPSTGIFRGLWIADGLYA